MRKANVFGSKRGESYLGGLGFGYIAVALRRPGLRARNVHFQVAHLLGNVLKMQNAWDVFAVAWNLVRSQELTRDNVGFAVD